MTTTNKGRQTRIGKDIDDTRRPVRLEATESFYKKLSRIAKECELSRYDALSRGLDALLRELQVRNSALNRNIKTPGESEVFRRIMGQVSRNYWAMISPEERCERATESAQARWTPVSRDWSMSRLLYRYFPINAYDFGSNSQFALMLLRIFRFMNGKNSFSKARLTQ
jgi:hypothetical protein